MIVGIHSHLLHIWAPMCLYITSSTCTVTFFIKGPILTLGRWSSQYCLLLWTKIDFSLASKKRSCAWALIDHFQCAPHSIKKKTLRKPEAAKTGLSAEPHPTNAFNSCQASEEQTVLVCLFVCFLKYIFTGRTAFHHQLSSDSYQYLLACSGFISPL